MDWVDQSVAFLADGREMGSRMRAYDWAATPLGLPTGWTAGLKVTLRTVLTAHHPMLIYWGSDHRVFYNDGFSASLGPELHPMMLGMPARAAWGEEVWAAISGQIDQVMSTGEPT